MSVDTPPIMGKDGKPLKDPSNVTKDNPEGLVYPKGSNVDPNGPGMAFLRGLQNGAPQNPPNPEPAPAPREVVASKGHDGTAKTAVQVFDDEVLRHKYSEAAPAPKILVEFLEKYGSHTEFAGHNNTANHADDSIAAAETDPASYNSAGKTHVVKKNANAFIEQDAPCIEIEVPNRIPRRIGKLRQK